MMLGFTGSTASDSMFLISACFSGEIRIQLFPPSLLRKTPSREPTTMILGSDAASCIARMDLPCRYGTGRQLLPLSALRKRSPPVICESTLQAETYMILGLLGSKA